MNLKRWKEDKLLTFLAILLIVTVIINSYLHNYLFELFWFCDIAAIILAIGILFNQKELIGAVFIAVIPAQLIWIINYFLYFLGIGTGRLERLFNSPLEVFIVSTLLHLIIIPISFYAIYKKGFSKKSFIAVFIFILLLPITYFSIPDGANINCVNYPCDLSTSRPLDKVKIESSLIYNTPIYLLLVMFFWMFLGIIDYFILPPILKKLNVKIEN